MTEGPGGAAFAAFGASVVQTVTRLQQARGVTFGCSDKRVVWTCGKTTLYRKLKEYESRI